MWRLAFLAICLFRIPVAAAAQDYSRARADSLIARLNAAVRPEDRMRLYNEIGRTFWRYQPDSALKYAYPFLELAEKTGAKVELQKAINLIGYMLEIKGDYAESWKYRKQDERLATELGDSTALAFAYYGLGNLSTYIGNYPEALDYHLKALYLRERGPDKYQLGWSYTAVGYVYSLQGLAEEAIEYRQKALECFSSPGIMNVRARDNVMRFLAEDYIAQKEYPKALELYNELLSIKRKRNDPLSQIAYTEEEIGWVYFNMGRYNDAIQHYQRALVAMKTNDVRREPITLNRLARAELASGQTVKARETARQALDIGLKQHRPDVVSEAQWTLAEEAERNGRLSEAIGLLRSYWATRDSIFSNENRIKVAAREAAYQVEKQQREIERLEQQTEVQALEIRARNRERNYLIVLALLLTALAGALGFLFRTRQQQHRALSTALQELEASQAQLETRNEELTRLNREKDFFFSVIGHDLRNPLNAISGLGAELSGGFERLSPAERKEAAARIHRSAEELTGLLTNLLAWARLELGSDRHPLETARPSVILGRVLPLFELEAAAKNITLQVETEQDDVVLAAPDALQLILRNLVSNALKFSFPGGTIRIRSARNSSGRMELSVSDDGVGIDPVLMDSLFDLNRTTSRNGTRSEQGSGLGLVLCRRMAERMQARLTVRSRPGLGSTFSLELPERDALP